METTSEILLEIAAHDLYVPDEEFPLPSPIPQGYWTWMTPDNMGLALMRGPRFVNFILDVGDLPDDLRIIETYNEDVPLTRQEFISTYL